MHLLLSVFAICYRDNCNGIEYLSLLCYCVPIIQFTASLCRPLAVVVLVLTIVRKRYNALTLVPAVSMATGYNASGLVDWPIVVSLQTGCSACLSGWVGHMRFCIMSGTVTSQAKDSPPWTTEEWRSHPDVCHLPASGPLVLWQHWSGRASRSPDDVIQMVMALLSPDREDPVHQLSRHVHTDHPQSGVVYCI